MTAAESPATPGEIRELCLSLGRPSLCASFIGRGLSVADVRAQLTSGAIQAETDKIQDMWAQAFAAAKGDADE